MSTPAPATNEYNILLDTPPSQPALDFDKYATALRYLVEGSRPQFAIGVFGSWGAGKTTLMRGVYGGLDTAKCVRVWFTAWRYEKEPHLIVPLLDIIREELVAFAAAQAPLKDLATKTASIIGKATYALLSGLSFQLKVPGAADFTFDANKALATGAQLAGVDQAATTPRSFYHASFKALTTAFEEFVGENQERRIVVFIDDLDRCLPENALEVLESMKLFFDIPGFVFVVGLDSTVIEAAVDMKYLRENKSNASETSEDRQSANRRVSGAEYIKKIFQVPFSLRPVPAAQIHNFLATITSDPTLPTSQKTELTSRVAAHLEYLVGDDGINPRELKRYINTYFLQRHIKPHLNPDVTLTLQTIQFRTDWNQLIYGHILAYGSLLLTAIDDEVNRQSAQGGIATLDPHLKIPVALLEYVRIGKPGNALLTQPDLTEYLYAGEATSAQSSLSIVDLVRKLAPMRTDHNARQNLPTLRSTLQQFGPDDAFRRSILQQLAELGDLDKDSRAAGVSGDGSTSYEERIQANITAIVNSLVEWQRRF